MLPNFHFGSWELLPVIESDELHLLSLVVCKGYGPRGGNNDLDKASYISWILNVSAGPDSWSISNVFITRLTIM